MPASGRARRPFAATVAALGAVAVTLTLAACGAEEAPDELTELDAYLAEIWGDLDETTDAPYPKLIVQQELIAECMAEQGFEYHPDPGNTSYTSPVPMVLTTEFAREFGYGYTTEAFGPGEAPERWRLASMNEPAMEWNENYFGALSPDAQAAYRLALYGPEPDDPEALPPVAEWGCSGRADVEVYGETMMPERFDAVDDELQAMTRRIQEDPRVRAAQPRWADCMAEAGYPGLSEIRDAEGLVVDLGNSFPAPWDMPYDEIREAYPDELAAIQQTEVTVAVADTTCREEVGYYEVRDEVELEVKQRIVDDYREDLEAWAAWARQRRAAED